MMHGRGEELEWKTILIFAFCRCHTLMDDVCFSIFLDMSTL